MSKTKTIKRKTTGFDILYRVVALAMAVSSILVAFFGKFFYILFEHKELSGLWDKITQASEADPGYTYAERALYELPAVFKQYSEMAGDSVNASGILSKGEFLPLWFAVGFFVLALILTLVAIGFLAFSNTPKIVAGITGGSVASMIGAYISFTMFATPIINGTVKISKLFNIQGILATGLDFLKIPVFKLEHGFFVSAALMLAVCIWAVSVAVVNYSDKKEQQAKKEEKI